MTRARSLLVGANTSVDAAVVWPVLLSEGFMLTCPRCNHRFEHSNDHEPEWLHCAGCKFEFRFFEFQQQSKRVAQKAAWPSRHKHQCLLSDAPHERTKRGVSMSFGEWVCWKFGHRKTADVLTMRSAAHELVQACCRLGQLYPAIPRGINTLGEVNRFWTDLHHRFALAAVESAACDAGFIATTYLAEGRLTRGEFRHIVDAEWPHSSWAGQAVTYGVGKPETRGLLLALTLLRASGSEIPSLLQDLQQWLREDGWDEYGCAVEANGPNSALALHSAGHTKAIFQFSRSPPAESRRLHEFMKGDSR